MPCGPCRLGERARRRERPVPRGMQEDQPEPLSPRQRDPCAQPRSLRPRCTRWARAVLGTGRGRAALVRPPQGGCRHGPWCPFSRGHTVWGRRGACALPRLEAHAPPAGRHWRQQPLDLDRLRLTSSGGRAGDSLDAQVCVARSPRAHAPAPQVGRRVTRGRGRVRDVTTI